MIVFVFSFRLKMDDRRRMKERKKRILLKKFLENETK